MVKRKAGWQRKHYTCICRNSGSLYRTPDCFFNQKWITAARLWPRVYPFCWISFPETRRDMFYVVYQSETILDSSTHIAIGFFLFSFLGEPLSFTETSLCQKTSFSLVPYFVFMPWSRLCSCQYDQGTQLRVNVVFCNILAESRLKLVSTYPGVLKRGLRLLFADLSKPAMVPFAYNLIITWFII